MKRARTAKLGNALARKLTAIGLAAVLPATAMAEPPTPPSPPQITKDCQTPGVVVAGNLRLPNVQQAIRDRKVIKFLTIGASASAYVRNVGKDYLGVIEDVLEKTIPGVDVQIINRGVSGELARDAAERLKVEVALTEPDLVLWQVGTNDALARIPAEEFAATLDETIKWLHERRIDVALIGVHYVRSLRKDALYQAIRFAVENVANANRVLRIGRYEAMQVIEQARGSGGGALPNEFDMTEAGYSCLAEYVVRAVTSGVFSGSLPSKAPATER